MGNLLNNKTHIKNKEKLYIMTVDEYNALDTYLTVSKMYDNDCYICQAKNIDYGIYKDENRVVPLKEFVDEIYYDCVPEELIGCKGFTREMMNIIDALYKKLDYIDVSLLPSVEETTQLLQG